MVHQIFIYIVHMYMLSLASNCRGILRREVSILFKKLKWVVLDAVFYNKYSMGEGAVLSDQVPCFL